MLRQARPDLILMDIALPGMNGLELTRKLKEDETIRRIRSVALTAFAMKATTRKPATPTVTATSRNRSTPAGCPPDRRIPATNP